VNTLVARAAPQTLFQRVGDVRVELSTPAGVTIRSSDGRVFQAQHLLSSIPPSDLVSSCPQLAPYPSPVSRYTSLAVINVTFESPTPVEWLPPHLRGFGYLIPPPERDPLLGVIFDSFTFREHQAAPADRLLRLTVMIGGDPDLHDRAVDVNDPQLSDEALINIALAGLRRHLPSLAAHQPAFVHLKRCSQAIPCYDVGHNQRLAHFEGALAEARLPVTLIGNLWGVGVNHCILRSQEQIRQLAQNEKFVPAP
jgi:oxygen-dependent protoporphyrinogen oxidase